MSAKAKRRTKSFGVGVDIESIRRFRRLDRNRDQRFFDLVFTKQELAYCFSKKDPSPSLAARFCAKEAVVKALASVGYSRALSYRDVEIIRNRRGVPSVRIADDQSMQIALSLSHEATRAIAFVIAIPV